LLSVPKGVSEAQTFNGTVFSFSDSDASNTDVSDFVAVVNTGAGMASSAVAGSGVSVVNTAPGAFQVVLSHTYSEELNSKPFSVSVTDQGGAAPITATGSISVADAPLSAGVLRVPQGVIEGQAYNGAVFTFADTNASNTDAADFVAVV